MAARRIGPLLATFAGAAAFAAPAAAQTPACTPDQLGDARTPIVLSDPDHVGNVQKAFIAGHKYHLESVIENANGAYPASSPYRQSSAKAGTIAASGPAGVTLRPKPETDNFRGGYELTAPRAASVTFTVTWIQVLTLQNGTPGGECGASAQITVRVFTLKPAVVSRARFVAGGYVARLLAANSLFRIRVTPASEPQDPAPAYALLRVRGGTTTPPSLRAPVAYRRTVERIVRFRRSGLELDSDSNEITIGLSHFTRPGQTVRFAFSLEIVQSGRRLGGMRGGATCKIRFSSRAHRHYLGCTPVGFARHA